MILLPPTQLINVTTNIAHIMKNLALLFIALGMVVFNTIFFSSWKEFGFCTFLSALTYLTLWLRVTAVFWLSNDGRRFSLVK